MITIDGEWFKDEEGRYLILRGVNLPAKNPRKHLFHENVSFVDRPIPLAESDEHFARLKYSGFTFLRLIVTWEAIEHAGPGIYDEAYLNYIYELVTKAGKWDINIFIDFHQDVWSRFTGGDGAPGWTLEKVGFEMSEFEETGAAVFHKTDMFLAHLLWSTNAYKLAAATMFTLFFGGNHFAPKKKIDGVPVQDFLQSHYIRALKVVATALKGLKNVVGYDVMNEPYPGYIGCHNLAKHHGHFQLGDAPTPFQSMALGDGFSLNIEVHGKALLRLKKKGLRQINPNHVRAWKEGEKCVWREEGIWDVNSRGNPVLFKASYFKRYNFEKDFYKPFLKKAGAGIHSVTPRSMIFIENIMGMKMPRISSKELPYLVFAGHWYDGLVLATKKYYSWIGFDAANMKYIFALPRWMRKAFAKQIHRLKRKNAPFVLGEFGVPFDLHNKQSYKTGNFKQQSKALDRSFTVIENDLISAILWNYSFDNTNEEGDHWNGEDFSIFSRDQQTNPFEPHSGIRASEAIIRPYCMRSTGVPLYMHFDLRRGSFEYMFSHNHKINSPTEIFLPAIHFGDGFHVELTDGSYEFDSKTQLFRYFPTKGEKYHSVKIYRK